MKYREIADGIFVDRPNRFIAHVEVNGAVETVHVKNTGRCKELLLPGTAVRPNVSTQPEFGTALAEAKAAVIADVKLCLHIEILHWNVIGVFLVSI